MIVAFIYSFPEYIKHLTQFLPFLQRQFCGNAMTLASIVRNGEVIRPDQEVIGLYKFAVGIVQLPGQLYYPRPVFQVGHRGFEVARRPVVSVS